MTWNFSTASPTLAITYCTSAILVGVKWYRVLLICILLMTNDVEYHFFLMILGLYSLFIYFWVCWIFAVARGLSPVAASRGYSSCRAWAAHCSGFSCCGAQAQLTVVQEPSCLRACGIFPDQGSNPCLLAGRFLTLGPPGEP